MPPPVADLKPLPFREAIDYFRRRIGNPQVQDRWTERWQDEHSAAFTVARSAGYDILGDISGAMEKAIAQGTTFEEFAKDLVPLLKAKGWWGRVERADGEHVKLGSMRRLRTIFNVNMRVSYAAGRWEQIQRTKQDLPYLAYSAVLDMRTRPAHRDWNGTVLPVDHPWWDVHYPPCGWNCRCSVIQLTESAARRRGGVTETPPSGMPRAWSNPTTGKTIEVPHGIDPGWGYNVGKAAMQASAQEQAAKQLADKLVAVPAEIAADALGAEDLAAIGRELAAWAGRITKPVGDARVVGTVPKGFLDKLGADTSGAIVLSDSVAAAMPASILRGLPQRLAASKEVTIEGGKIRWAITDANGAPVVLTIDQAGPKGGNLVESWKSP